ncbi:MAG TPA: glycosyltransferase family 87 protein [Sphingomicrobium sp.]|nr:glycosyltransferase family 87 protein [Sphingomicrobium sp.]
MDSSVSTRASAFDRFRRVGTAMAILVILLAIVEFFWNAADPTDRDFISFWGAAQMVLSGDPAAAYDQSKLHVAQTTAVTFVNGDGMPFPYPPAFLALVAPFGLLPFAASMALWSAATFALYFVAIHRMFPESGLLAAAFPPVFINAAIGQNAFVTAAIFVGGMLLLQRRPFAAGLLLGCLVIKPQLGLLLPIALLAARQWRAIAGAALSSVGLLLAGAAAFGLAATEAWLAQMPLYVSIGRDGLVGWHKMASVYAAMRQMGAGMELAFAVHLTVAAAAAAAVWLAWRSKADLLAKASVLAAATMLASPYAFPYDAVLLVIAFFWLARRGAPALPLALLWLLPILTIVQIGSTAGPVNLQPVVPIGLLILSLMQLRASRQESRAATNQPAGPTAATSSQTANAEA